MPNDKTDKMHVWWLSRGKVHDMGFSLLEVMTALAILALVSSSVLVVIDRCVISATDSALRMDAFKLARENMEEILASDSVTETVEYGTSDAYGDMAWQTVVEAFPEPATGNMWIRAISSAEYVDSAGETQTVELEHWIAELTDQQADQLAGQQDLDELAAEQLVETLEDAAEYAGVDAETFKQWVENGMLTTEDGAFIRYNIDLYVRSNGNPSAEDKARQVESIEELAMSLRTRGEEQDQTSGPRQGADGIDPTTGLPYEKLEQMEIGEVIELLKDRQK